MTPILHHLLASCTLTYILTYHHHAVQGALTWLEQNQDKPLEKLQADAEADDEDAEDEPKIPAIDGEVAKSLVCNDCGKKFKNSAEVNFHATKSGHTDFAQSTEEIAPLTEEQKAARLEELRQKLATKRALQAEQDKEEHKRNEVRTPTFPYRTSHDY